MDTWADITYNIYLLLEINQFFFTVFKVSLLNIFE